MPRVNLTGTFIQGLQVDKRVAYQDEKQRGLELRASPNGDRSWSVVYVDRETGLKQRLTLGKYPAMDPVRARAAALAALRKAEEGANPAKEKRRRRESLDIAQIGERFIEEHGKARKRSWKEDERILQSVINPALGNRKVESLTRRDIVEVLAAKAATAPTMADRSLAVLRKMLNWARVHGLCEENPARDIPGFAANSAREKVMTSAELKGMWHPTIAAHGEALAVFRMLALTGERLGEVSGMKAGEIDLEAKEWTIPSERTKNKLAHIVPLSEAALEIVRPRLDGRGADDMVFSRGEKAMDNSYMAKLAREMQKGKDKGWTPHDIRRTVATGMASLGVQPHVVEAVLNHISGSRAGVAGIYNRYAYQKEKRQALDKWAKHLTKLVAAA